MFHFNINLSSYLFIYSFHCFSTFVGDIFSVNADPQNTEVVDYYLLRYTKIKIKLTKRCIDDDNQSYPTSSVVIEGIDYPLMRCIQLIRE